MPDESTQEPEVVAIHRIHGRTIRRFKGETLDQALQREGVTSEPPTPAPAPIEPQSTDPAIPPAPAQ